ncbi:hypothetical protein [Haliea sp.]|uniref:hypothetical protein n=1 Tax=Haliea sp. TaxID=1932666 RepID=UPI0025BA039F|nr:hypothetical protein [Haliea sp.]
MNGTNRFFWVVVLSLLFTGCEQGPFYGSKKVRIPYYERCNGFYDRLLEQLKEYGVPVEIDLVLPDKSILPDFDPNGIIVIGYTESSAGLIEPTINAYLHSCGPNASIIIPSSEVSEREIRAVIEENLDGAAYMEDIFLHLEDDRIQVFFTRKR